MKEYLKNGEALIYGTAQQVLDADAAHSKVMQALNRWQRPSEGDAFDCLNALQTSFPDDEAPKDFWHKASDQHFRDFFTWGHNHDFGFSATRAGAMENRHIEITTESLQMGFLPENLEGQRVLDIGCWSGGDLLILAGMGANVIATEEHPRSAQSARALMELVNCPGDVIERSAYQDNSEWRQSFDIVYCSGVLYHVTDPVLLLRICFSYLKPGGRLIIETKAWPDSTESGCHYSGSSIKGWNFFAPTELALARWFYDAGFPASEIEIYTRPMKRFLACAVKGDACALAESAGFSRPGSWLEGIN